MFRLFLKAGAKVQLLFNLASFFEKKINFLFLIYSLNLLKNVAVFAGCKGNPFFDSDKLFEKKILSFFVSR